MPGPGIAVFGSSEPVEGEPLYDLARAVGAHLAAAGYEVVTGGYGGVMEAASRGAREAGGEAYGVLCGIFPERLGNRWLSASEQTSDLYDRTRSLVERSCGFVVLDGKAGTLAELAFLWALHRAGCLDQQPVLLLEDAWKPLFELLTTRGQLDATESGITRLVSRPEEIVETLIRAGTRRPRE